MRTNIVMDDNLVAEAFRYAVDIHTKKDPADAALREFVRNRKLKDIRELRGKILFEENYDYKSMRS